MPVSLPLTVTFSDCDPSGIVHESNTFRWIGAGILQIPRPLGGHEKICTRLGAVGIGLISASAGFRFAIRDGDRTAFTGHEVRGLFKTASIGLIASPVHEIRSILGKSDVR